MTIFSKLIKRLSYLILSCLFCWLSTFANLVPVELKARIAGISPEAIDVKNFYIQNISGISQILPLIGKDSDGTIASFRILTIPNTATRGSLYLNGVLITVNQVITPVQAKQLQFDPQTSFTGNVTFTYTVTDNEGLTDATAATYTIPVTNNASLLVCSGGGLGSNILGAQGTFSAPYITPNPVVNCINDGSSTAAPLQNLGDAKPALTNYTYASTSNSLGPEGRYSFLKTLGSIAPTNRNCIKTDWVASDHTGDGGYAMIVNGSPNSATFGETFYKATSIAVCPNTLYEFSAYVINVLPGNHTAATAGTEPNISFYINNLLVSTSGPIAYAGAAVSYVPQWVKVGGLWYSGPNTSVDLRIDNATFVAGGNDLGLDDISMAICGPEITYPDISLTPQFCSYGVLPLKADVKASVNTFSSYIFQNSTDGGATWEDMGTAKTGSPVFNAGLNIYEYVADYGDIPIIPSMDGYRYRLKVATEASNLAGATCNVSADKIITVSTMNIPAAGADIVGCNSATTAKLAAAAAGETWATVAGNPTSASIDQSGNISGMTINGIYKFQLSNLAGCSDTVNVTRDEIKSAGLDVTVCSPATTLKLADAGTGYKWEIVAGNPAAATIDAATGNISGMTADGIYHFILRSDYGGCTDEVLITRATIGLTHTKTDVLCFGASTGAIDLSVSGGTGPYTFTWSTGHTSEDLVNLVAGSYSVTVTDSKGCSATLPITISQPQELTISSTNTDIPCFGATTGSIDLSVSGGTAPYTYAWTGGLTTEDLTALGAGTYDVTVTDANNCTATASVVLTQPAAGLALSSTKTDLLCFGATTGSIDLSVSGGTAPYTYAWTGGIATQDLASLGAGTYNVTVTDANNCTASASVVIVQPAALILSSTKTDVLCFGATTGTIDLSVSGGTAPYTYAWTGGITTQDLSGLAIGTYNVTVTDANNCTASASIVITQPAASLALSSTKTDVLCFGATTGAIDLSVSGGTAPYTYSWTGGITTQDLSGLASGIYSVTVTDANNCTATASVVISQPAAVLALSPTKTDVLCFGAATGSIDLSVTGGTAPYTYAWTGGISTQDLASLGAGTYNVTVTDANNCTATASVVISQPAAVLALSSTKTDVLCFGATTGAIDLSVSGGTAPYTYAWTGGITTQDLSGLASGTYNVTVTDANNCTATASVVISQPAAELALSSTKTDVLCFGATTGSIDLSVSGGTAPYTYSWTGGITTQDLSGLASGTYSVTVTDANNCTATASVVVTQPAAVLALTTTKTDVLCFGAATGTIDLSVSGGTAPYTYAWTGGISTQDLASLGAGTYNVTVTDANNCTATASVVISQPAAVLALSSTKTDVLCFGATTGAIDLSVSGGTAPYTYAWTGGLTTKDISSLASGTYNVTVTDANNCTATASVVISQPAAVLALSSTKTDVLCFGANTGAIDLSVSGGTAPYTYAWTGGITTQDLSGLASGTYNVTVTDANNCTATASVVISQPAAVLAISSIKTDVLCFGAATGSIDLSVTGGTAPYTYAWTGGISTQDLASLGAGTYNVTVTDANNCTATASVVISQPTAVLAISSIKTDVLCFGAATGSIDLSVTGGTAPYTYAWTGGITTQDLSGLASGTYSVTVTDANNCTATASVVISQPAAILALSSTKTDVLCFGAATGSIDLNVTGGTAPYTYAWTGGIATEDLSGLGAGTYNVTVTDANSCTATASIEISQPAAVLALATTKKDVLCFGGATGVIDLSVTGGTAPYTYAWTGGLTTEDISLLASGIYNVTVTDANSCTATASIEISQPAAVLALTTTKTDVLCFGAATGTIDLSVTGGTAPYTYTWTGGITTEDISSLASGSYSVTVTDANNCKATTSVVILQPATAISLKTSKKDVLCFGASTGSISLSVSGGTAPYTYAWTGGAVTKDPSGLAAGTYSVIVKDANNCTATTSVIILQPDNALALSLAKTDALCFGSSTGAVNLSVSGGKAPYKFLWTGGKTTEDIKDLAAGTYKVTVSDANNCVAAATVTISQPLAPITISVTKTDIPNFGASSGLIDLKIEGGRAPYSYSWNNGKATEDLINLSAGSYTVTVTDTLGCTATSTIVITQPAALEVTAVKSNVSCYGTNTGSITLNVKGGIAPFTYKWNTGHTTKDLAGIVYGNYKVIVTDAGNNSVGTDVVVTQPDPLKATLTVKNASCLNTGGGTISSKITGGVTPYKISWAGNSNLSAAEIVNLKAGVYQMMVTDAAGCTISVKAEVTQAPCAPIAQNDKFEAEQDKILLGDVAPNDLNPETDKLTFTKLTDPDNGKMTFEQDGKFAFTPDKGFTGTLEFFYRICNSTGACDTAKVSINVKSFTIVSLTPELSSVWEGRKVSVTARLLRPFHEDVTITVAYSGKAEKERDYLVLDQYMSLKIPKGSLSTTEKMTIAALNDGFQEGDEDIILKINTVSNPDVIIGTGAVVIINDVYPPPPPTDVPQDEPINTEIVPDALMSPNGDGSGNEFFTIRNIEFYPDNEVLIFNRWGNELFAIKNYNNSDKNFKGFANKGLLVNSDLPLSDGVYFFIITTYNTIGVDRTKQVNKGYLILKR